LALPGGRLSKICVAAFLIALTVVGFAVTLSDFVICARQHPDLNSTLPLLAATSGAALAAVLALGLACSLIPWFARHLPATWLTSAVISFALGIAASIQLAKSLGCPWLLKGGEAAPAAGVALLIGPLLFVTFSLGYTRFNQQRWSDFLDIGNRAE
jgi:hypothetical protein